MKKKNWRLEKQIWRMEEWFRHLHEVSSEGEAGTNSLLVDNVRLPSFREDFRWTKSCDGWKDQPVSIWRASQSLTVLSAEAERIQLWFWKISKDFCWSWNLGSESRDRTALVCPRSLATMQGGESPCVLILMTPLLYIVYITITNIEFTR